MTEGAIPLSFDLTPVLRQEDQLSPLFSSGFAVKEKAIVLCRAYFPLLLF